MEIHEAQRPVVVGVDGSESSSRAVRWAAREAAALGVALRLVQVFDSAARRTPWLANTALEGEVEAVRRDWPDLAVDHEMFGGDAVPRLSEEARRARLLVVGNRGLGALTGLLIGSVSAALAAHAACPLIVVRGPDRAPHPEAPVVVGVNGTVGGEGAIAFAFEAADARRTSLVAVHVWREPMGDPEWPSLYAGEDLSAQEHELFAERLAGWQEKYPDVAVSRVVTDERPLRALVERSVQAHLIVMGVHTRSGIGDRLLGSLTRSVLHQAQCPVAVVPSGDDVES